MAAVVLTGLGVVNASGIGVPAFWRNVGRGTVTLSPIRRFDAAGFPVRVAGQVDDFDPAAAVPRRLLAKTARFTHFALTAAAEALGDAAIDLEAEDRTRVGAWFGNNTGGWDLCERGFAEFYGQGADLVNPWQATAWFMSAPQGFTTIRYGLRGLSKSFAGDRSSGAAAMYHGYRSVVRGHNDVVLAGGCEAPVSPLALLCLHANGDLTGAGDPRAAYRPFDQRADGLVVGEGGTVLILESAEHARRRGAGAYVEVLGGAHGSTPDGHPRQYAAVIRRALAAADCTADDIDLVLCDGAGRTAADRFEAAALAEVFGGRAVPVSLPKSGFGHLYGAAFGTDVLCGLLAAGAGLVPPTPGFATADPAPGIDVSAEPRPVGIERFLVTSCSRYGSAVAMVFRRPAQARPVGQRFSSASM
jgi:3-oxoacyl-[acyl-carrier-protein] synthase II